MVEKFIVAVSEHKNFIVKSTYPGSKDKTIKTIGS